MEMARFNLWFLSFEVSVGGVIEPNLAIFSSFYYILSSSDLLTKFGEFLYHVHEVKSWQKQAAEQH